MSESGIITFAGVVHPWMCDAMGHLNVRHYVGMFDDASFQLLGRIAGTEAGWADVRLEIDYRHETRVGELVTIHSSVEKIGSSSLAYRHRMVGTLDGVLHAEARTVTVRFDLATRSKRPLDAAEREKAEALLAGSE